MDGAAGARRAMTGGLVVDAGGVLMRAQPRCLSKPMHSESNVEPMVRPLLRFRGRDTTLAIPATSMRWLPGSPCGHPRAQREPPRVWWRL